MSKVRSMMFVEEKSSEGLIYRRAGACRHCLAAGLACTSKSLKIPCRTRRSDERTSDE